MPSADVPAHHRRAICNVLRPPNSVQHFMPPITCNIQISLILQTKFINFLNMKYIQSRIINVNYRKQEYKTGKEP